MEGGGDRKRKTGPISLDWVKLMPPSPEGDQPLPQVLVVEGTRGEAELRGAMEDGEEESFDSADEYSKKMSDKELHEKIGRQRIMLGSGEMSSRLPDGGRKLMKQLKRLEAEQERRKLQKVDNKCKKVIPIIEEPACNADNLSSHGAPPSKLDSQSTFSLRFCSKLDDKGAAEPISEGLSTLNSSKQKTVRVNGPCLTQRNAKFGSSSREVPFKSPNHLSINISNPHQLNNVQSGRQLSGPLLNQYDGCSSDPSCFATKRNASVSRSTVSSRRNRETVVLVDEELEVDLRSQVGPMDQSTKETRIYFPSRDDPETIEICYTDLECLTPGSYLSSNIMNFYIRYLQQPASPNSRKRHDYHFFNTYFYNKLQEIECDKETFKKFRRWWKGVNIFEKAYIFLPIYELSHWSLVIICIPNKEDESGPIILHLDSLGMHNSRKIFPCVKSFLTEEWEYVRHEEVLPKLPIADSIWKKLSRRIDLKVIEVPQQKNESDCGVFVLYFMERFIEEAPERLRKKDLHMFGRKWFQAEEASSLRDKILKLLEDKFENAEEDTSESNSWPVNLELANQK